MLDTKERPSAGSAAQGAKSNHDESVKTPEQTTEFLEETQERYCRTVSVGEATAGWWSGALAEVARQHGEYRIGQQIGSRVPISNTQRAAQTRRSNRKSISDMPLSDPDAEPWEGPLRERIDRATLFAEPLRIDGVDLLRLIDQYLPFWLSGGRLIVVPDVLVGRYIRDAYAEAGEECPPIHVEAAP